MVWKTSRGVRTLQGAEAELVRLALASFIDQVSEELDFSVQAFNDLTQPAKWAVMLEVARGLLSEEFEPVELTAINEAAVACLFDVAAELAQLEADGNRLFPDEPEEYEVRHSILAAVEEVLEADGADSDHVPGVDCDDHGEWQLMVECLADAVLWDNDFELGDVLVDEHPDEAHARKKMFGIDDNYFTAIAPDPSDQEVEKIIAELRDYCVPY
ncbi:MAG: hypothetical protein R3C28_11000 [Pirellulaceae bacterium]